MLHSTDLKWLSARLDRHGSGTIRYEYVRTVLALSFDFLKFDLEFLNEVQSPKALTAQNYLITNSLEVPNLYNSE
jgi:hypothetical protein